MRLANDQSVFLPHDPGWKGSGEEMARVVGYSPKAGRYTLEWLPEEDEGCSRITRKAETVHRASERGRFVSWVQVG